MTRETKIGLLVGLAFIIVIGILLSDHLTSSTEPPQAPLAQAGNSVRAAVGQPAAINPPITNVGAPNNAAPRQPVATRDELTKPQATEIIKIATQTTNDPNAPTQVAANPNSSAEIPTTLQQAANQQGEELVPVNGASGTVAMTTPTNKYVAQPSDSVSKMAAKFLGGNTKANRAAIIKANPSLQSDPNKVIVGRTYTIPGAVIADGSPIGLKPASAAPTQAVASSPEHVYTVQPGDSLWRIADQQLGDAGAMSVIQHMNQDVLKGSTNVRVGMKLRLPAKPVAAAR